MYPALPFVLLGDSGQHDPEIYSEVVRENPGRILAIYIRDVSDGKDDDRAEEIGLLAEQNASWAWSCCSRLTRPTLLPMRRRKG